VWTILENQGFLVGGRVELLSQVITCPKCDRKLVVRDELKGRALICPECKGRFTVPADELQPIDGGTRSGEVPSSASSDMAFLDDLGPSSVAASAKTPVTTRSRGDAQSADATVSYGSSFSRAAAIRAKRKNAQLKMIYTGGGIAVVAVIAVVAIMAMPLDRSGTMPPNRGDTTRSVKTENKRFGMTEAERKRFFEELVHAVDQIGPNKQCRDEWRRLGREKSLGDQQISEVLKEGMEHHWTQPAIVATVDQRQKINRQQWIRTMNETKREPIMSQ
jgi:hypothetical protein